MSHRRSFLLDFRRVKVVEQWRRRAKIPDRKSCSTIPGLARFSVSMKRATANLACKELPLSREKISNFPTTLADLKVIPELH